MPPRHTFISLESEKLLHKTKLRTIAPRLWINFLKISLKLYGSHLPQPITSCWMKLVAVWPCPPYPTCPPYPPYPLYQPYPPGQLYCVSILAMLIKPHADTLMLCAIFPQKTKLTSKYIAFPHFAFSLHVGPHHGV